MADPAFYPQRPQPCRQCLHYFVTYVPEFPHGCRDWNIQSRGLPAQEVFQSTGLPCPRFSPNPRLKKP